VIEVSSTHGTFEWFLEDALGRGYKLGFIAGSDSYKGRPGAEYPGYVDRRFAKGGLTALYATELTLEALFEALKSRRCYGTTGARILVRVDADGHLMGEEYAASSSPRISASVAGCAPLERVELFRGLERIYSHPLSTSPSSNRVRILWEGASRKSSYSGLVWSGSLKVTGRSIASVEKVRFDTPRSRVFDMTGSGLRWHSVTCGYRSGIILELEGAAEAELELMIHTLPVTRPHYQLAERLAFRFGLGELVAGPKELEIGPLDRKLTISLAPEPGTEVAQFAFTDPSPKPGINPYWLRVVQTDMEMAWTSPIFVDYVTTC